MEIGILLDIAIILFVAKAFGEIAERLKVDALVGEVAAGFLVGPILMLVKPAPMLEMISSIGVILLVFLIGLSTRFDSVKSHIYKGSTLAIIACVASLVGGFAIGLFVLGSLDAGIFLGIALMGTSTAIPIRILMDRGEYQTRVGQFLITASMGDDIITIIGLSCLASYFTGIIDMWRSVALLFVILGFMLVIVTVGSTIVSRLLSVVQRLRDEQMLLSIPLAILFAVTFFAENIGVASIVGSFLAGMMMARSDFAEKVIEQKVKTIAYGFFVPLFFAYSALIVDINLLFEYWWLIALLTLAAVMTKVVSSGIVASAFGFTGRDRNVIAVGMIPRGECGIVISQIALALGAITNQVYGAMIAMILVTVILTPILYMFVFRSRDAYRR